MSRPEHPRMMRESLAALRQRGGAIWQRLTIVSGGQIKYIDELVDFQPIPDPTTGLPHPELRHLPSVIMEWFMRVDEDTLTDDQDDRACQICNRLNFCCLPYDGQCRGKREYVRMFDQAMRNLLNRYCQSCKRTMPELDIDWFMSLADLTPLCFECAGKFHCWHLRTAFRRQLPHLGETHWRNY